MSLEKFPSSYVHFWFPIFCSLKAVGRRFQSLFFNNVEHPFNMSRERFPSSSIPQVLQPRGRKQPQRLNRKPHPKRRPKRLLLRQCPRQFLKSGRRRMRTWTVRSLIVVMPMLHQKIPRVENTRGQVFGLIDLESLIA